MGVKLSSRDILVGIKCGTTMGINDNIRNILPNFKAYKPEAAMLVPLFVEKFYQRIWAGVEEKGITKLLELNVAELEKKLLADSQTA